MERKTLNFEIKAFDDSSGELSGYGNVTGNVDRQNEIVAPGAYSGLEELVTDGFSSVGHDWLGLPVGTIEEALEDERGLFVRIKFHSTADAQAARLVVKERIDRGKSVGLSIGYDVLESSFEMRDGQQVRVLKKIKVFEVSIVTVPANQEALVSAAKHINDLSGVPLDEHTKTVVSVVEELVRRATDKATFRKSDGRDLSSAQKSRIAELVSQLSAATEALSSLIAEEDASNETMKRMDEARALEAALLLHQIGVA